MRQKLFLDLDDVVLETSKAYKEVSDYLKRNKESFELSNNIEESTVAYILHNYSKVKVSSSFVEVLPLLKERFDLVFVSMYVSEEELAYKQYLARLFGAEPVFLDSSLHHDKSEVDMEGGVFVDDRVDMLATSNASTKVLFSNLTDLVFNAKYSKRFKLVYSWAYLCSVLGLVGE